jgi:hypothetical protein
MEIQIFHHTKIYTSSALTNSTLIILFSELLKNKINYFFQIKIYIV